MGWRRQCFCGIRECVYKLEACFAVPWKSSGCACLRRKFLSRTSSIQKFREPVVSDHDVCEIFPGYSGLFLAFRALRLQLRKSESAELSTPNPETLNLSLLVEALALSLEPKTSFSRTKQSIQSSNTREPRLPSALGFRCSSLLVFSGSFRKEETKKASCSKESFSDVTPERRLWVTVRYYMGPVAGSCEDSFEVIKVPYKGSMKVEALGCRVLVLAAEVFRFEAFFGFWA